jgi:hypothetical protein
MFGLMNQTKLEGTTLEARHRRNKARLLTHNQNCALSEVRSKE